MRILFLLLSIISFSAMAQVPVSVSIKTSSYTIPAKKWARVYVEVENGGTFTIDTVTAMDTDAVVGFGSTVVSSTAVGSYTMPSNYYGHAFLYGSTAVTYTGVASNLLPLNDGRSVAMGPSNLVGYGNGNANKSLLGYAIPGNATNRNAEFKLPGGTVINGTGTWRATVELYER